MIAPLAPDHPLADTVARLLEPIPGDSPGGIDLRFQGYSAIEEARRNENARLPQGVWQREVKQADWPRVEQLCIDALASHTKDLRIACWLAEAWVQRFGFAGLAPGLTLAEGLCRLFWDDLQPRIGDGDPAAHLAAIEWLNQRLPIALRQVPVLIDAAAPETRFDWGDHLEAERLEAIRVRDAASAKRAEAGGSVTQAMIAACQDRTATAQLAALAVDTRAGLAALASLDATLDRRCGHDAPGLGNMRDLVAAITDYSEAIVATRQALAIAPAAPAPPEPESPTSPPPLAQPNALSRSTAYRQLATIATYLRENEPHSPVPYILDQLVEWGNMPLDAIEIALRDRGSNLSILIDAIGFSTIEDQS